MFQGNNVHLKPEEYEDYSQVLQCLKSKSDHIKCL